MSMIRAEHLTFSYPGGDPIFEDVSFQVDTGWRLGFTGRNGRGKTTFLQLLMGQYEYAGTITASVEFDYFPYRVPDPSRPVAEVLSRLCPSAPEWELVRELSALEVGRETLERPFETLSHGERTKSLLAALFLNEGRFPLIDEPTNHLDARGRALVSDYLSRKRGFILVSHDRRFLDGCVDHILSLNRADIQVRSGSFSSWLEEFQCRQQSELEQDQQLRLDIKRLRQSARRAESWSNRVEASKIGAYDKGFVGHKSAKMMKRAKSIEARRQEAAGRKAELLKNLERAEPLKLSPLEHHAPVLAEFSDAVVWYGDAPACRPATFQVRRGERVILEGKNGSGKSSLLKALMGQPLRHTGTIETAPGLIISYAPQDTGHLRGGLRAFAREQEIDESLFKTILRKMGFERALFDQDMADFSQGQKKKVVLAASLCRPAHLYIWDEPLNYIDLYSRMQIEALLREFSPSMLLVEHDRAFLEAVGTQWVKL